MDETTKKLEEEFKDVTDITDPYAMEKVLAILAKSRKEDDEYMKLLVDKLKEEVISWYQPPYQHNYKITKKPKPEEVKLCASGPFTKAEGDLVTENWKRFVKQYNVPDTPICLTRWRNRTQRKRLCAEEHVRSYVAAYLAQGLQRSLYQVQRYFKITHSYPVKQRSYSPTEEKIMEICFYHSPSEACVIVPEVLGREPRGINNQYSRYFKGKPDPKPRIRWDLDLAAKLIKHLMEYSGCSFKKLKYNQFDQKVWSKAGEEFDTIYRYLREFWTGKLHVQLFAKCTIKLKSLRNIIFKKLKNSPYEIWKDIRWKDFAKEFPDGFTGMFLYKVTKAAFRHYPAYREIPLSELMAKAAEENKNKKFNKRLKLVKYHKSDGTLSFIECDISVRKKIKEMTINQ